MSNRASYIKILFILFSLCFPISLQASTTEEQKLSKSGFIIKHDQRPTDLEYVLMSKHAYDDNLKEGQDLLDDLPGWKVFKTKKGKNEYQGVVFKNENTLQFVIAHRGTELTKDISTTIQNLIEDVQGVIRSKITPQKFEVFELVKEIATLAEKEGYHVSFTGHSLGAFLAELSVFFCYNNLNYPDANAVTFESPGSQESLDKLQPNIKEHEIPLEKLDIVGYLGNPNEINTFNHHVGSIYQIEPDLGKEGWVPIYYNVVCHKIDNFVEYFRNNYNKEDVFFSYYVTDWPVADWGVIRNVASDPGWGSMALGVYNFIFSSSRQKDKYFKYAKWDERCNCYHILILDDNTKASFDLIYTAHYDIQMEYNPRTSLPLKHFNQDMQSFLNTFYNTFWGVVRNDDDRSLLAEKWEEAKIPKDIINYLTHFRIVKTKDSSYIVTLSNPINDSNADIITINKFRTELSRYLHNHPEEIEVFLSSEDPGEIIKEDCPFVNIITFPCAPTMNCFYEYGKKVIAFGGGSSDCPKLTVEASKSHKPIIDVGDKKKIYIREIKKGKKGWCLIVTVRRC